MERGSGNTAKFFEKLVAQASSRSHGPWLLPRFDRIVPRRIQLVTPEKAELIVDGLRVGLYADGSYTLGAGWLPMGREIQSLTLPVRLDRGSLFVLSSQDDTWLYRARDFTATLEPLGRIDQAVATVSPGFTALNLRLRQSGALVAFDPVTGQLSWGLDLPELADYGAFVAVDDWFGAYIDPLRGLMVTRDAGLRYERFQPSQTNDDGLMSSRRDSLVSASQIENLRAIGDALEVTLTDSSRFLLTRRGDVLEVNPENRADRTASKPRERMTEGTTAGASSHGNVKSWLIRLEDSKAGGWPIEQAVTRGVPLAENLSLYLHEGVLHFVTLDEGKVIKRVVTDVPRDQQCLGATGQRQRYFLCHDRSGSALYRFDGQSANVILGYWEQKRSWGAVTDAGVIVQGTCDSTRNTTSKLRAYCGVSATGHSFEFEVGNGSGVSLPILLNEGQAVVFELPSLGGMGALRWYGTRRGRTEVIGPKRDLGLLEDGFFSREISLLQGELAGYLVRGEAIQGYRITLDGQFRLGPLVTGATAALTRGPLALVPDSSGYAYESLDGGMTWQRTRLPVSVVNSNLTIPNSTEQYGCSTVGCVLGDWMRLGWSTPEQPEARTSSSQLVMLESPPRLTLERRRRTLPRITCQVTAAEGEKPRGVLRVTGPRATKRSNRDHQAFTFENTAWPAFYGDAAPDKAVGELGFDRGFRGDRYVGRLYARIREDEKKPTATVELRVLDSLRSLRPWSSRLLNHHFDQIETLARWFAHPRYGESAVPLSTTFDVGGERGLVVFDDAGSVSGFLVTAGQPMTVLPDLQGHSPKRVTDFVSLKEASYLLGTEPKVALFEIRGQAVRVLSEEDYRAHLSHARLRLVRDRTGTRIGYLLSSIRLRSVDVVWSLYPIDLASGRASAPLRIPLDMGLRICDKDDDGWLIETELDDIADAHLLPENVDVVGRGRILLLGSEQGLCVERVSFTGQVRVNKLSRSPVVSKPNGFHGLYLDTQGQGCPLACLLENPS
jgi:hypothetical protein